MGILKSNNEKKCEAPTTSEGTGLRRSKRRRNTSEVTEVAAAVAETANKRKRSEEETVVTAESDNKCDSTETSEETDVIAVSEASNCAVNEDTGNQDATARKEADKGDSTKVTTVSVETDKCDVTAANKDGDKCDSTAVIEETENLHPDFADIQPKKKKVSESRKRYLANRKKNKANIIPYSQIEQKNTVIAQPPRGLPKSGRFWKISGKAKMSSDVVKHRRLSYLDDKMADRKVRERIKFYQTQIRDQIITEKRERKQQLAEKIRRRAENEKKSEVVQVITNTNKLKKMKKKHIRSVEVRDTLTMDTDYGIKHRRSK